MSEVLLITEVLGPGTFEIGGISVRTITAREVPTTDQLVAAPVVVILGPISNGDWGLAVAGAIRLGFQQGAIVAFLYNARLAGFDPRFLEEIAPDVTGGQVSGSVRGAATSPPPHPVFAEYVTRFGSTDFRLNQIPDGVDVLAHTMTAYSPYETAPTAIAVDRERGALYLLPCHIVGGVEGMLECLLRSVRDHRQGRLAVPPQFHAELLLPGEASLDADIRKVKGRLGQLESQQETLTRHKLLVGSVAGASLEELVVDELNLVLEGSDIVAHDVEEQGVEDFQLVDGNGARQAIGESKAAAGGVTLNHVNQINSHRSELFEVGADELPGILVVNTFRNDLVAERRQAAPVDRIVRHAARMNVLILRTWDLYQLVARRLAGEDDSADIAAAIRNGGGWLEVTDEGIVHHNS